MKSFSSPKLAMLDCWFVLQFLLFVVVSTDYVEHMEHPLEGLAILGLVRSTFMEEQSSVHKLLYDEKFSGIDIIDLNGRNREDQIEEISIYDDTDSKY